jgi:hypothetical protein
MAPILRWEEERGGTREAEEAFATARLSTRKRGSEETMMTRKDDEMETHTGASVASAHVPQLAA